MRRIILILAGAVLASVIPGAVRAQESEEPEIRTITVTTFNIPPGAGEKFTEYLDTYMIPAIKEDPNILGFRYAAHHWGSQPTAWLFTEYESLAGLAESEEWQERWFDEHYPEGSPELEAAEKAAQENFLPVFVGHTDNILSANMNRAK